MAYKQPEVAEDTSRYSKKDQVSYVRIKAVQVEEVRPGVYSFGIPTAPLSETERQTLQNLFPTLSEQAYSLLTKEAVLGAITNE